MTQKRSLRSKLAAGALALAMAIVAQPASAALAITLTPGGTPRDASVTLVASCLTDAGVRNAIRARGYTSPVISSEYDYGVVILRANKDGYQWRLRLDRCENSLLHRARLRRL